MEDLIKELFVYAFNLFIGALIVMYSWNYLMPDLFNLEVISYWQSFIMLVLTGTLFKTGRVAISRIEGEINLTNPHINFRHEDGFILDNDHNKLILIRGWGNLTGIGAHNLSVEEAANIQDTFADFIVERLNFRK